MTDRHTDREEMAQEYDAIHNRLFLLQILVLGILLAFYQFSGASAGLANGLAGHFGESAWYVSNAVYVAVSIFGFAAFMSPFSYYSGHILECHYGLSKETAFDWFADFVKSLFLDILLATILFSVIYALLRWMPNYWWLAASAFYILFAVIFATIVPLVIISFFHKFDPLEEGDLNTAVLELLKNSKIKVTGIFKWNIEEQASSVNVAFSGFGSNRRIILGDTLLSGYTQEEIIAILACEIGHHKNRDMLRLMVTSSVLAVLGFFIAHHCLVWLTSFFDISAIYDIGAAPIFMFSLFIFSLVSMPFANYHSRRREFAADAYAIKQVGSVEALVSAFEKLAEQNLSSKEPAAWIEFLLHSHPSLSRRIERVRNS